MTRPLLLLSLALALAAHSVVTPPTLQCASATRPIHVRFVLVLANLYNLKFQLQNYFTSNSNCKTIGFKTEFVLPRICDGRFMQSFRFTYLRFKTVVYTLQMIVLHTSEFKIVDIARCFV